MVDTTGWTVRNKLNEYFAKQNHVRLAKNQATKALIDVGVNYSVLGIEPDLVLDFGEEYYAFDQWYGYQVGGTEPAFVADFSQEIYGA